MFQVYTGVNKQGFIQPSTLANQDIVITSYETLRKEIDYVDLPHSNSKIMLIYLIATVRLCDISHSNSEIM